MNLVVMSVDMCCVYSVGTRGDGCGGVDVCVYFLSGHDRLQNRVPTRKARQRRASPSPLDLWRQLTLFFPDDRLSNQIIGIIAWTSRSQKSQQPKSSCRIPSHRTAHEHHLRYHQSKTVYLLFYIECYRFNDLHYGR